MVQNLSVNLADVFKFSLQLVAKSLVGAILLAFFKKFFFIFGIRKILVLFLQTFF